MSSVFKVEFHTDNDAFVDDPQAEIARVLRRIALDIKDGRRDPFGDQRVLDINGNTIGSTTYGDEEVPLKQRIAEAEEALGKLYKEYPACTVENGKLVPASGREYYVVNHYENDVTRRLVGGVDPESGVTLAWDGTCGEPGGEIFSHVEFGFREPDGSHSYEINVLPDGLEIDWQ